MQESSAEIRALVGLPFYIGPKTNIRYVLILLLDYAKGTWLLDKYHGIGDGSNSRNPGGEKTPTGTVCIHL